MPTFLTYSQAPIPTGAEALNGPANLLAMGTTLDTLVVLKATSQSNRDTLYANVPAGTLVSCAALGIVWQKTTTPPTAAAWRVLSEVGTVATSGVLTAATNFTVGNQYGQRLNGWTLVRGSLTYSGATVTGDPVGSAHPGNIVDLQLCTISTNYQMNSALGSIDDYEFGMAATVPCSLRIGSDGVVYIAALSTSGVLASGDAVRFTLSWPGV